MTFRSAAPVARRSHRGTVPSGTLPLGSGGSECPSHRLSHIEQAAMIARRLGCGDQSAAAVLPDPVLARATM